jgi:hypothetical protein
MQFVTKLSTGIEVIHLKFENKRPDYLYAHKPSLKDEKGRWRIDLVKFDEFLSEALKDQSFGDSIDRFMFGFEMADFDSWGWSNVATYVSYRPKDKTLLSVGKLDWLEVKDKSALEQLKLLQCTVIESINLAMQAKRKPKNFNHVAFAEFMKLIFDNLLLESVVATPIS